MEQGAREIFIWQYVRELSADLHNLYCRERERSTKRICTIAKKVTASKICQVGQCSLLTDVTMTSIHAYTSSVLRFTVNPFHVFFGERERERERQAGRQAGRQADTDRQADRQRARASGWARANASG